MHKELSGREEGRQRRSIRIAGFDYASPGAYFITICVRDRESILGHIRGGVLHPSLSGDIVLRAWKDLPGHYSQVSLDAFTLMPNHLHGILLLGIDGLRPAVGAGLRPAPTPEGRTALPEIVRAFKAFSARRINHLRGTAGEPVWQRGYYEHVIRNDYQLFRLRRYIVENPARWEFDRHGG